MLSVDRVLFHEHIASFIENFENEAQAKLKAEQERYLILRYQMIEMINESTSSLHHEEIRKFIPLNDTTKFASLSTKSNEVHLLQFSSFRDTIPSVVSTLRHHTSFQFHQVSIFIHSPLYPPHADGFSECIDVMRLTACINGNSAKSVVPNVSPFKLTPEHALSIMPTPWST